MKSRLSWASSSSVAISATARALHSSGATREHVTCSLRRSVTPRASTWSTLAGSFLEHRQSSTPASRSASSLSC